MATSWPYPLPPSDPRHGTVNGYGNHRCRCPDCTEANTRAHRRYMDADPARKAAHAQRVRTQRERERQGNGQD